MIGKSTLSDAWAVAYLRDRRKTFFFGDLGPPLPWGATASWRSSPHDPHGWHANMVGFIEAPTKHLGSILDIALTWFSDQGSDTWIDADEFSPLFRHQQQIDTRGFRLNDDWSAMVCRQMPVVEQNPSITLYWPDTRADLLTSAWIAERAERSERVPRDDLHVRQRMERYWREYQEWGSQFVLAALDGQFVGAARLTQEDMPVVVGVATLPSARNRGVATAVTAALTRIAHEEHGICALYADRGSQAARIYGRLGYKPLFQTRAWVRRLE